MAVFNIPLSYPFLQTLADGILIRYGNDPLTLAQTIILLPTQRGCLSLKSIFQNQTSSKIIPKIIALADLETVPLLPGYIPSQLPPEMPKTQQLGLLSQLILKYEKEKTTQKSSIGAAKALKLAEDLLSLLDEFHTSEINPSTLKEIIDDEFANHWQITLNFLTLITDFWPKILEEKGFMDGSIRRRENLKNIAKNWLPSTPVILAGTTGTRPATAQLAQAIHLLPQGNVVLPGFIEEEMPLPPTHPQYTLHQFIKALEIPPKDIHPWTHIPPMDDCTSFIKKITSPHFVDPLDASQIPHPDFKMMAAESRDHEAASIACLIRDYFHRAESENTSPPSIAVITPDQELGRRLQAHLSRWDLIANNSAGTPLGQTVVGVFLTLLASTTPKTKCVEWLTLLKHPLFFKHFDRGNHLQNCRQLDLAFRKKRFPQLFSLHDIPEHLESWYGEILEKITPLITPSDTNDLTQYLIKLKDVAESICSPETLWSGPDGLAIQKHLENLTPYAHDYPSLPRSSFAEFLNQYLNQEIMHDPEGIGSPIRILGALEARQYDADITILAGLNEGTWPKGISTDPWLNQQMRLSLGLPDPQRRIGLSAHDFCLGFASISQHRTPGHIYLSRSLKEKGTPTIPSRWWQRIELVLEAHKVPYPLLTSYPKMAKGLYQSLDAIPLPPPSPSPSLSRRPLSYSVSDIELLMRDPYSFYAKKILSLKKLDPLDRDLEPRDFGQLVHLILERTHQEFGTQLKEENLLKIGEILFTPYINDTIVKQFWWPRFTQIAHWLEKCHSKIASIRSEAESVQSYEMNVPSTPITLKTIIDRIEFKEQHTYTIIDYKTGTPPTLQDVALGFSPQLPIEALILEKSNPGYTSKSLEYWHLKGGNEGGDIRILKNIEELIQIAEDGVNSLLQTFLKESTPYLSRPWGETKLKNTDYQHLSRAQEWEYTQRD